MNGTGDQARLFSVLQHQIVHMGDSRQRRIFLLGQLRINDAAQKIDGVIDGSIERGGAYEQSRHIWKAPLKRGVRILFKDSRICKYHNQEQYTPMEKEIATYGLKDRLLYYEALLAKKQMFNGHILKLVAAITMFIDHFSVAILMYGREGLYTRFGGGLERAVFFERLNVVTQTGRLIGRTAFPIYCFLLVEGFFHTSSRAKYFLRLLLFCFLSEYAFDHALYPQASTSAHCSVFVTLTLGFCMMWIMETLKES